MTTLVFMSWVMILLCRIRYLISSLSDKFVICQVRYLISSLSAKFVIGCVHLPDKFVTLKVRYLRDFRAIIWPETSKRSTPIRLSKLVRFFTAPLIWNSWLCISNWMEVIERHLYVRPSVCLFTFKFRNGCTDRSEIFCASFGRTQSGRTYARHPRERILLPFENGLFI